MSNDALIGLIFADMLEAEPFIKRLSLRVSEKEPFIMYTNGRLGLVISGIGKANAAMACAYFIAKFHPSCICNLGAAGAADKQYHLGECYHITRVIEPDRPHLKTGLPHEHIPGILDAFSNVTLATQDRPVIDPEERSEIGVHAQLVDMEGASVVQVCRRFRTRCYLFKFVSDTSDHLRGRDIAKNIKQYRNIFFEFFLKSALPAVRSIL